MHEQFLPGISIDCVIFGFHANQLKILLLRFKGTEYYALPGGFIVENENLEDAAQRILNERTGLSDIYLKQFHVFGDTQRRDGTDLHYVLEAIDAPREQRNFLSRRFISIGYYALIDYTRAVPIPDAISDSCDWWDLEEVPSLIFDHNQIVTKALQNLRFMLSHSQVGQNLLPDTFTMKELQALHETILGQTLVRSNFQRKMLSTGLLERVEKKMTGAAHKAPYLYRFNSTQSID